MSTSRPPAADGLRVLHVVTRYTGGSVRRLLDAVDAVDARHVVAVGPDSEVERLGELDGRAELVVVGSLRREVTPVGDARALVDLVRLVRRVRPHVVHTHQSKGGLLGRVAARAGGVGIVYHSASMASFGPGYGRAESAVFRVAEWATAPLVTRTFVVGRDLADRLAEGARVPRRKLVTIRSSIPADRFRPPAAGERGARRRARGVDPSALVVAYVGSLEPRKGVADLPALVAEAAAGRPVTLLVAGDGPLRDDLAADRTPGVEVVLLGHVGDVADVMGCADALVLPSSAEGLPQVLVQAAMVGVPFAAYDVDGVGELLDLGARGAAAPLGDRSRLAAALGALLDDAAAGSEAVAGAAPAASEAWREWDPAEVAARYREHYAADLAARRRAPLG